MQAPQHSDQLGDGWGDSEAGELAGKVGEPLQVLQEAVEQRGGGAGAEPLEGFCALADLGHRLRRVEQPALQQPRAERRGGEAEQRGHERLVRRGCRDDAEFDQ